MRASGIWYTFDLWFRYLGFGVGYISDFLFEDASN